MKSLVYGRRTDAVNVEDIITFSAAIDACNTAPGGHFEYILQVFCPVYSIC